MNSTTSTPTFEIGAFVGYHGSVKWVDRDHYWVVRSIDPVTGMVTIDQPGHTRSLTCRPGSLTPCFTRGWRQNPTPTDIAGWGMTSVALDEV